MGYNPASFTGYNGMIGKEPFYTQADLASYWVQLPGKQVAVDFFHQLIPLKPAAIVSKKGTLCFPGTGDYSKVYLSDFFLGDL